MQIKVGVGVVIINEDKVLIGKRINSHGHGTWAFPGGHLEFSETLEVCAIWETLEETGLKIDLVKQGPFTNNFFEQVSKHYVTLFMVAQYQGGIPEVKEPDKCIEWRWVTWAKLPSPLFAPIKTLIDNGVTLEKLKNTY